MNLSTPLKGAIAAVLIVLTVITFYMVDYSKKFAKRDELQAAVTTKNGELKKIEDDIKDMDKLQAENDTLKGQLKQIVESGFTPENENEFVPNYLEKIESLVSRVRTEDGDESFDITSITPGAQVTTGGGKDKDAKAVVQAPDALKNYPTRTFSMAMKGKYETLVDFLDRLGKLELQRLVTVNKITLAPAGTVKEGSPTLTITIPLTAYLRTGGN
jgi:Tfp pilus assembly protein PilO